MRYSWMSIGIGDRLMGKIKTVVLKSGFKGGSEFRMEG